MEESKGCTICVVLDHNTVLFQKEKKKGGLHIKKITGIQDSGIVNAR
jgi:predicted metal-dependent phosphoesterase TrpH